MVTPVGDAGRSHGASLKWFRIGLLVAGLVSFALAFCGAWDVWGPGIWAKLHTYPNSCRCGDCVMRGWPGYTLHDWFPSGPRSPDPVRTIRALVFLGAACTLGAIFGDRLVQWCSRKLAPRANHCECGYDLRGLPGERCPECGKPIVSRS